jgi:hypothetical protein
MQYLRFDVAQSPEHPHEGERGGALVNCWMKDRTEEEAYRDAKAYIEKQGWMIVNLEIQYPIGDGGAKVEHLRGGGKVKHP